MRNLILASQSPRRRELLARAGLSFTVRSQAVEEVRAPGETPRDYVTRLARAKAEASCGARKTPEPREIVLGADTVVVLDEHVLEKPADAAGARVMLQLLSGRTHAVLTGICLLHSAGAIVDTATTMVRFMPMEQRELDDYVSSGEPMDKAGAYAIQGLASKFIDRIEGCYSNVMGLPLSLVYHHLKTL